VPPILFPSLRHIRRKPSTNLASIVALSRTYRIELPLEPRHLGVLSSASKNDLYAYATFGANHAPIFHQEKHYPKTDRTELPLEPFHLGV
jgi:hypothetical protein